MSSKTMSITNPITFRRTWVTEEVFDVIIELRRLYREKDLGCRTYLQTKDVNDIICTEEDIAEYYRLRRWVAKQDKGAYLQQVEYAVPQNILFHLLKPTTLAQYWFTYSS